MNIVNLVQSHGVLASGISFGAGMAAANVPFLVQKFVQLPWISAWIRRNPKVAEAIVDELKKDVDAVASPPPPAAPGAAGA